MTPVRRLSTLMAALLLLAPVAAAASAQGELETGSFSLGEGAQVETLGLDMLALGAAPPALDLTLTDVAVHRLGASYVVASTPVGNVKDTREQIDERAEFASATVSLALGTGDQLAAVRALGATVATVGVSDVRGVGGARLAAAIADAGDRCPTEAAYADYCFDVFGAYEIAGDAVAQVTGEIKVLLHGPTLRLVADGETVEYASGVREQNGAGPAAISEETWILLTAKSATGSFAASQARLYSAAPTLRAQSVTFHDADGELRIGVKEYRASEDDVRATGELVLTPGPVPPAGHNGDGVEPVYASSFTTRVAGDVESIDLNAASAFMEPAAAAGILGLLAIGTAAAVYAWQHISFLAAALYTRLNKPDILDNDVRSRIYDIIRDNPGISAREVHRRSEQSWGTVVYHLRQLERHHLVVSRSLGRTRNYYENHGKYRGMEVQLACLQSERARVLARAIVAQPAITQEQLAAASGYPQPTTSYYVRKLKQAGLIEEQREGRYVRYVPHADLPRFIAMSEQSPTVGSTAASGVQA